jgi:3-phosphoshikimate 1-carboxyvinyltransferase
VSSQFVSALMMVGPTFEKGLHLQLENEIVSSSYIRLTASLMNEYGIEVHFSGNTISIPGTSFSAIQQAVEADWTAASYWYAMVAMSESADLKLSGLKQGSYQGDAVLPGLFRHFGVETSFEAGGIILKRTTSPSTAFDFDFRDNPDLVQTMAVLCAMCDRPFHFTGTQTLQIKETDRIAALDSELQKLGILISYDPAGRWMSWDGCKKKLDSPGEPIKTYQDHRMAMAFATASLRFPGMYIEDPLVVSKSYPTFWSDLEKVGFEISKS